MQALNEQDDSDRASNRCSQTAAECLVVVLSIPVAAWSRGALPVADHMLEQGCELEQARPRLVWHSDQ